MASFSYSKETEIIQAFTSISRYLDDLLNIDNLLIYVIILCLWEKLMRAKRFSKTDYTHCLAPFRIQFGS